MDLKSCRGRDRTFTRQLAIVQSSVVDPGHYNIAIVMALYYVCPVILTPETRGHVCQKFHHPTFSNNSFKLLIVQYYNKKTIYYTKFKENK